MTPTVARNRILLILDTTHGQIGGTEQNTLRFAQALKTRGYAPIVVEVGKAILAKSEDSNGLEFLNIPTTDFDDVRLPVWKNLFAQTQPHIVIRSKTWAGCVNWRLDIVAAKSNATYLSWEHHPAVDPAIGYSAANTYSLTTNRTLKTRIKTYFRTQLHMRSVEKTVAVSHAVSTPLMQYYPVPSNKVDVIYPGVDFSYFTHIGSARKELRTAWGIPESAIVIGSLGRLVAHKGNDFTLKVMAELLRKDPSLNIWCVIAGKGGDLQRLQSLADELGITERVCFPGWQESAPKAWSAIDLFLMPSADEGLGMTLIEAAACGCLPLGAAIGGMKEILRDPLNDYALPAQDLEAWVTMASTLIEETSGQRLARQQLIYSDLHKRFEATQQWNLMVNWVSAHAH
jgi:glycosyltransferase involved in cell wall biosynthesis